MPLPRLLARGVAIGLLATPVVTVAEGVQAAGDSTSRSGAACTHAVRTSGPGISTTLAWHPTVAAGIALAAATVASDAACAPDAWSSTLPVRLAIDTTRRRRAVEYSDWYARRLTIHRIGSYTMLPLFAAEYALGDRLLDGGDASSWVKPTHVGVAIATGALFTTNTVTGLWNLYDARHDPAGRTRRYLHAALMLAADAGFAYTGTIADRATRSLDGRRDHRNAALTSMGISGAGTLMMWLWKH